MEITGNNGTNLGDSGTPSGAFVRGAKVAGNGGGGGQQYRMSFKASKAWTGATSSNGEHSHTITLTKSELYKDTNLVQPTSLGLKVKTRYY